MGLKEVRMKLNRQAQDVLRQAIKLHSQSLGMSQLELAEVAKISQPTISRFIAGTRTLSDASIDRVRRALSQVVEKRIAAVGIVLTASNSRATTLGSVEFKVA
jgi:predicted transcriptional regulator